MTKEKKISQTAKLTDAQRSAIGRAVNLAIRNGVQEVQAQYKALVDGCKGVAALPLSVEDATAIWEPIGAARKAEGMSDAVLKVVKSNTIKLARCAPILARQDLSFITNIGNMYRFATVLQKTAFNFAAAKRSWTTEREPDYAGSVAKHFKSILGSQAEKGKWISADARAAIALCALKCGIRVGEDFAAMADMDRAKRFLGL